MLKSQQGVGGRLDSAKTATRDKAHRMSGRDGTRDKLEDSFTRHLGSNLTRNDMRDVGTISRSDRSKSTHRSRRKTIDGSQIGGRFEVPQVSHVGCGCKSRNNIELEAEHSSASTPVSGDHIAAASCSKQAVTPLSLTGKLTKSVSGIFSRRSKPIQPVSAPNWEVEWGRFRDQHDQEIKDMKQMYADLQLICQELKSIGLQHDDEAFPYASPTQINENHDQGVANAPRLSHAKRTALKVSQYPGSGIKPCACERDVNLIRRSRSVPRIRSNGCTAAPFAKETTIPISIPIKTSKGLGVPTIPLFEEIVQGQKAFLRSFCASLVKHGETRVSIENSNMDVGNRDAIGELVSRLLPNTSFAKRWHLKYGIEAWVNRVVLQEFSSDNNYGLQLNTRETSADRKETQISSWNEFQKLAVLNPTDAIDPDGKAYHCNFHMFCNRKFQVIHDELQWWDTWPEPLVEEFLEAMKHVWRAHKLSLTFTPPASIFCVKASTLFDGKFMDPLDALTVTQCEEFSQFTSKVGFMVTPGYVVQNSIIKSQVYLMPRAGLTSHIQIEGT